MQYEASRTAVTAELSGGERQRVALARVMSRKASVTLLDEPGTNLDRLSNLRLAEIVSKQVRSRAGILIVASHRLDELLRYEPRRMLILENGHLVRSGTADMIASDPQTAYVASLLGYEMLVPVGSEIGRVTAGRENLERPSIDSDDIKYAWKFGEIRESQNGLVGAAVVSTLYTENGPAVRVTTNDGHSLLIPPTDTTSSKGSILLEADAPVIVRA